MGLWRWLTTRFKKQEPPPSKSLKDVVAGDMLEVVLCKRFCEHMKTQTTGRYDLDDLDRRALRGLVIEVWVHPLLGCWLLELQTLKPLTKQTRSYVILEDEIEHLTILKF